MYKGGRRRPSGRFPVEDSRSLVERRDRWTYHTSRRPESGELESLDPGLVGEFLGQERLDNSPGHALPRLGWRAAETISPDRIHQNITRQAEIPQELAMVAPPAICGLPKRNRQISHDPIDGKVVQDRAVNHEPVPQPPLGAAAAFAPFDHQVAQPIEPDPGARISDRSGNPVQDVMMGSVHRV